MNQYDHLKNKLHNYKVDIDKDKLWANTSHAIPQRKRRRAALIVLFAGLVTTGWLLYSTSTLPFSASMSDLYNRPQNATHETADAANDNTQESNTIETSFSSGNVTTESISPKSVSSTNSSSTPSSNNTNSQIKNKKSFENKKLQSQYNTSENIASSNLNNISTGNTPFTSDKFLTGAPGTQTEEQKEQSSQIITTASYQESFANRHITENELLKIVRDDATPVDYLITDILLIPVNVKTEVAAGPPKPPIRPLTHQILQSFQMVQGVGFSAMKIHSLAPETDDYAALLEEKMESLELITTSVEAELKAPVGFSVKPGLQWNRLTTVTRHQWETVEVVQEEGVTTVIIDENGIPQSITGTRDVTRTINYQTKRFTQHQQLDLTLSLHKQLWKVQHLSVGAFLKGNYNLMYTAKGTILGSDSILSLFDKNENPYLRVSPFSFGGGLTVDYFLSPRIKLNSVLFAERLGYKLKDKNTPLEFKHFIYSVGLGFSYLL